MSKEPINVGDSVVMSSLIHWVLQVVAIEGDDAQLRTPWGDLVWFPLNTMAKTNEPFELR